ncbi:hypothetical protein AB0D49_21605 [Streptomyces sp. NPDC048290]|uniref:hypothetical protein n=1 Tax=Streptomyces sp. NPDC048290 TaxID=3155811 RepID=UPI0034412370
MSAHTTGEAVPEGAVEGVVDAVGEGDSGDGAAVDPPPSAVQAATRAAAAAVPVALSTVRRAGAGLPLSAMSLDPMTKGP